MEPADALFCTPAMSDVFSAKAHVRQLLAFESALTRAEARAGVVPAAAAEKIAMACRVDLYDVAALYREAALAGTPAIPLVRMLTDQVGAEAGAFVHLGATSQDALDTALVLQMRQGLDLLIDGLLAVGTASAQLAERHRQTPMPGRTLLQQALPITFGLKAARWLDTVTRQSLRLRHARDQVLAVQFGGAAGTLAALGPAGPKVAEMLGEELGLPVPALPWHAERDRVAEVATALGIVAGTMAKIATDLVLLGQTEVSEVREAPLPGKGGSSAMPQKRNPVDSTMSLASARLAIGLVPVILNAMAHEYERAAGAWQAEWQAVPHLFGYVAGAVDKIRIALEELEADSKRMRANLDASGGLIMAESLTMALARRLGRPEAFRVVREAVDRAVDSGVGLREAALAHDDVRAALSPDAIEQAFDPMRYLGSADVFIDRALGGYRDLVAFLGRT
ncbi:MAG: 3-carboxy-cis,cis-muconate cycloisomerase [Thermomicrobiales bacterium]